MGKAKQIVADLLFTLAVLAAALAILFMGMRFYYRGAYPVRYADTIAAEAGNGGLDPHLLCAVIRTESGFRPGVQSSMDARGLMQITPDTFYWARYRLGEEGPSDLEVLFVPEENIRYGAATLSLLLEEFGSLRTALAAYHAGWGNVSQWLEDGRYSPDGKTLEKIPFGDTDAYVDKVFETAEIYRRLYH